MTQQQAHFRYKQNIENLDNNTSHIQILDKIPDGSKVLDVGCACGDLGAYLFYHKHCSVYGLEYDKESIAAANGTNAYMHVEQTDLNTLEDIPESIPKPFDRIIFGDVLEHLNNPEQVLRRFIPLLSNGGRVVISLPNITHGSITLQLLENKFTYGDSGILDKTHVRFFTRESIASLTASLGLKISSATRSIWDLPGLPPHASAGMLPPTIIAHIAANPHAYVLQYIFEAVPSEQEKLVLEQHNLCRLDAFTPEEEIRIAGFRGKSESPEIDRDRTLPFSQLPPSEQSKRFLPPHLKPWLKQHMPRPLWNGLKELRNTSRALWIRTHSMLHSVQTHYKYVDQILRLPAGEKSSAEFVKISSNKLILHPSCPKTIAFYLPQFHPFAENDEWWGRGFTEWSNVTKAVPQFVGHYQPHLPIDLGFYDLRVPDVMKRQIELAKLYGVYGFCFHYYWFSGKRLMERPLFDFLHRKDLNMPFCLCWANEPWSRRWDGSEDDLLMKQELQPEDDARFIEDLLPFINDLRYVTIDGRPVLIIYRPHLWKKERVFALTESMRAQARRHGFKGLYMIAALTHDFYDDPRDWGFDAGVEFPPHLCGRVPRAHGLHFANKNFRGAVQDTRALVNEQEYMRPSAYTTFKTAFPSWDNTARKNNNAFIFHHAEPEVYARWLKNILQYTYKNNGPSEQYVFINAWNEWAEGAHLEPDRKYGYAFLQATADSLAAFAPAKKTIL